MSTVYGPVPSWRFGRSLGIDVITPPKTCTFNCVYCQLGRTMMPVAQPEELHRPLVGVDTVLTDLERTVRRIDLNTVDIITFSGTGEPTLHPELGTIANAVKQRIPALPLAILTNASLLHRPEVREHLAPFDVVVAKVDAGDDETFRRINRPVDVRLDVTTIIDSIRQLQRDFKGELALEVMLLSSEQGEVTNVEGPPLRRLVDAIRAVNPDVVHLGVPYRPTVQSFVQPPSQATIAKIAQELAGVLGEAKLWVYGVHDRRGTRVSWLTQTSLERDVVTLLKRRPCRDVDVSTSLGIDLLAARNLLARMHANKIVIAQKSKNDTYYSYPATDNSNDT